MQLPVMFMNAMRSTTMPKELPVWAQQAYYSTADESNARGMDDRKGTEGSAEWVELNGRVGTPLEAGPTKPRTDKDWH